MFYMFDTSEEMPSTMLTFPCEKGKRISLENVLINIRINLLL
jgi:hypothetical protein